MGAAPLIAPGCDNPKSVPLAEGYVPSVRRVYKKQIFFAWADFGMNILDVKLPLLPVYYALVGAVKAIGASIETADSIVANLGGDGSVP